MTFDRFNDQEFVQWSRKVKERDNFICQVCYRQGDLNSHHMNSWDWCVEERYLLDNGITLCIKCHEALHQCFGKGSNTRSQFEQFQEIVQVIFRLALRKTGGRENSK